MDIEFCYRPYYYLNNSPLLTDNFDCLGYSSDAYEKANIFYDLSISNSWSIGINAPWGYGKTTYLNLLLNHIKKLDHFIIIQFNPRCCKSVNKIQEEFLQQFSNALSKYNYSLRFEVRKYITLLREEKQFAWIDKVVYALSTLDKESQKEKINKAIMSLQSRIIVTIDDLDRLDKSELYEVFKILRGNADFQRVVFITVFDSQYVSSVLGNSNYVEKFFDFCYSLPAYTQQELFDYIALQINSRVNHTGNSTRKYLEKNKDLILKYIHSIRDAKRYINIIFSSYLNHLNSFCFNDILLISLLRLVDERMYISLVKRPQKFVDGFYLFQSQKGDTCLDITNRIFSKNQKDVPNNSICREDYFFKYFKNTLYSHEYDFRRFIENGLDVQDSIFLDSLYATFEQEVLNFYTEYLIEINENSELKIIKNYTRILLDLEEEKHNDKIVNALYSLGKKINNNKSLFSAYCSVINKFLEWDDKNRLDKVKLKFYQLINDAVSSKT